MGHGAATRPCSTMGTFETCTGETMTSVDRTHDHFLHDRLRAAGHFLDQNQRRLISLAIGRDGVVVTLDQHDIRLPAEAVLLTYDDLADMADQARALRYRGNSPHTVDPLFPTGYEDFLRALDSLVRQQSWSWLRLVRVGDMALLHYDVAGQRDELTLAGTDIQNLLDNAFYQRGHGSTAEVG